MGFHPVLVFLRSLEGELRLEAALQVSAKVHPRPLVCLTYRFKALLPMLHQAFKSNRLRAQWEAVTFLSALKYLPPHNLFIFHSDKTGVYLGAPPPAECTQRPRQPSAPIRHFSCRHQRHIQEDFMDAGRLCLPGTSLLPAPEASSCRLPRRACGLSAMENRPLLSDDACRHPGFQRCWLNCGGQPLLPVSLDWGRGGHIFSNIQKRPYPSEFCKGEPGYSYSEGHARHGPGYPES